MALSFHPNPGTIVICNFNTGFQPPEMVKRRPVVVVSPRLRRREGLCAVVPLSTSEPEVPMPFHHLLKFDKPLPYPWESQEMWVKADMLATVSLGRLNLIRLKREYGQPRRYIQPSVSQEDYECIKKAILQGLGINHP